LTPRNPLVVVENLAAHWNRAGGRRLSDHFRIGADLALPARGLGSWLLAARETPFDRIAV
jgi:hypothetical protein